MFKRICSFLVVLTFILTLFAGIPVKAALNDDTVNVIAYNQYDEPWASQQYGSSTLGITGCGIVSTTNALNYLYNVFDTTEKANAFMKEWATYAHSIGGYNPPEAPSSGGYRYVLFGTEVSNPPPLVTKYGSQYNIEMPITWTENWNSANLYNGYYYNNIYVNQQTDLKNYLSRGSVAVAHVPGHFICLAAYNPANDHFLVLDSAPTTARGTGNGVAWVSASDLSGGRPALTVGGFCVINTTIRRNASPYQLNDTTMMIYDGESFPTMKTAFSTAIMPSKNHTQGLKSLKMMYSNPTAHTNKAGGYTYITLDSVTDFTDYDTIAFDLYLDKAMTGSHGFQLNFCASGEDGYNCMVRLNDYAAGWHSFNIKRSTIGKAVDTGDWTKVKYIRLMWWNYQQLSGATYFAIDNFRAINTDLENAKVVSAQIEALPESVTLEDKEAVTAARTAYDALTEKGKTYVSAETYSKLTDAETAIGLLEQDVIDRADAAAVDQMIEELPTTITLEDEEQLTAVADAYNGLTDNGKGYVKNLSTLIVAVDTWNALKEQDDKDRADAAAVDALVNALPLVEDLTLDHEEEVQAAVEAYNALNDTAKGYVTTLETLETLVARIEELQFVYGDVNEDGLIDNKDLGALQRYLNDWDVTLRLEAADVNADGQVDNKDYAILQRYLNDWDVVLGPEIQ